MRTRTAPATLIVVAFLAAAPSARAAATEPGLWSAGGTTLRGSPSGYVLRTASGERPLTLPAGVEVEELFALRQRAFLSGRQAPERPAPGDAPRRDLYLALLDAEGLHALPTPAADPDGGRLRENAVPLASNAGELAGLVWLEGADRQSYAVRAATWDGLGWSATATVAGAAPGSQLALSGATLADGSQLVVWSRFDGQDDEIVFSRLAGGRWSAALPLAADNAVPDITPAVVAVPGGALATWSRYDGHDYRVVLSRFDGQKWSAPAWVGAAGSTYPTLLPAERAERAAQSTGAAAWLTYATSSRRGWAVVELDADGHALRRGEVADAPAARPALAAQPPGEIRLLWATSARPVELQ
ncbi:MAG: hypothetical protein ABI689_02510 [Thermoanaerobaculia bacterium]